MNMVLILFSILTLAAVGASLLLLNHLLEEYRKSREHERQKENRRDRRVEKMLDEEPDTDDELSLEDEMN